MVSPFDLNNFSDDIILMVSNCKQFVDLVTSNKLQIEMSSF